MDTNITPKVDLAQDSLTHLLAVSFAKSSSPYYSMVIRLAQGAEKYNEIIIGKNTIHLIVFSKDQEDASRALTILQYIYNWKAAQVYAGGKILQNLYRAMEILRCYLVASACNDWTAHCYTMIDDPYSSHLKTYGISLKFDISPNSEPESEKIYIDRYIFPCSLLKGYFRFETDHPSRPEDQIQAKAIEFGCDWCPFFNHFGYKKTGTKIKF